jgi:hypothetical protein
VVVVEDGGDPDVAAEGLDVAGDDLDGGYVAALDRGRPLLLVTLIRSATWA